MSNDLLLREVYRRARSVRATSVMRSWPINSNGPTVPVGAGVFGAWTEIWPANNVGEEFYVFSFHSQQQGYQVRTRIASGLAGAEVFLQETDMYARSSDFDGLWLLNPPLLCPASTRLSVSMMTSSAGSSVLQCSIGWTYKSEMV